MTPTQQSAWRDVALGLGCVALAFAYWFFAGDIADSMLSDEVGAAGVPKALAVVLGICGALVAANAWRHASNHETPSWALHARAWGLLVLLAIYIAIGEWLGYPISIALLIGVLAVYCGATFGRALVVISIVSGGLMGIIFIAILKIRMPLGLLESLFSKVN